MKLNTNGYFKSWQTILLFRRVKKLVYIDAKLVPVKIINFQSSNITTSSTKLLSTLWQRCAEVNLLIVAKYNCLWRSVDVNNSWLEYDYCFGYGTTYVCIFYWNCISSKIGMTL